MGRATYTDVGRCSDDIQQLGNRSWSTKSMQERANQSTSKLGGLFASPPSSASLPNSKSARRTREGRMGLFFFGLGSTAARNPNTMRDDSWATGKSFEGRLMSWELTKNEEGGGKRWSSLQDGEWLRARRASYPSRVAYRHLRPGLSPWPTGPRTTGTSHVYINRFCLSKNLWKHSSITQIPSLGDQGDPSPCAADEGCRGSWAPTRQSRFPA